MARSSVDLYALYFCSKMYSSFRSTNFVCNKISKHTPDVRIYRVSDPYCDHYLHIVRIILLPRWKKQDSQNVIKNDKLYLLQEENLKDLYCKRPRFLFRTGNRRILSSNRKLQNAASKRQQISYRKEAIRLTIEVLNN